MKIYTKYGDRGKTKLYGGDTVSKTHVRVEAYGTMDELCSLLGLVVAEMRECEKLEDVVVDCEEIQQHLFDCGSDLATPRELRPYKQEAEMVEFLEERIDRYMEKLPKLESFIIPGGHKLASMLHQCRTVARRLERRMVAVLENGEAINPVGQKYVNRLSDYFFVAARWVNLQMDIKDTLYKKSRKVFKS